MEYFWDTRPLCRRWAGHHLSSRKPTTVDSCWRRVGGDAVLAILPGTYCVGAVLPDHPRDHCGSTQRATSSACRPSPHACRCVASGHALNSQRRGISWVACAERAPHGFSSRCRDGEWHAAFSQNPASRCGSDLFFPGSFSALADSQAASPRTSRPIVDVQLRAPIRGRLAAEVLYVGDALRGYDAPVPPARFAYHEERSTKTSSGSSP